MDNANDKKVGYGKPPKATQFTKGQSGNPRGKPKGAKSMSTVARELLDGEIAITRNGRVKRITRREAIALAQFNKAVDGNVQSARQLVAWAGVEQIAEETVRFTLVLEEPERIEEMERAKEESLRRKWEAELANGIGHPPH